MRVVAICPKCDARLPVDAAHPPAGIKCGRCGHHLPLAITPALSADTAVDRCPICSGAEFYTRKDFDPKLGLTIIVCGALTSAVFYFFGMDLVAYGLLAAAVVVDFAIAWLLPEVTVCYRCHSEFRGRYTRTAPAFDLHTADVLELEYERRIGRR